MNFKTTAEFEIARTIKEKACYLAVNPQKEETAATETETYQYILPDGSSLDVIFRLLFFIVFIVNLGGNKLVGGGILKRAIFAYIQISVKLCSKERDL